MFLKHRRFAFAVSISPSIVPVACKKAETPEKPAISTFASPDDASSALLAAAKSGDQTTLTAIFGPRFQRAHPLRRRRSGQKHLRRLRDRV